VDSFRYTWRKMKVTVQDRAGWMQLARCNSQAEVYLTKGKDSDVCMPSLIKVRRHRTEQVSTQVKELLSSDHAGMPVTCTFTRKLQEQESTCPKPILIYLSHKGQEAELTQATILCLKNVSVLTGSNFVCQLDIKERHTATDYTFIHSFFSFCCTSCLQTVTLGTRHF